MARRQFTGSAPALERFALYERYEDRDKGPTVGDLVYVRIKRLADEVDQVCRITRRLKKGHFELRPTVGAGPPIRCPSSNPTEAVDMKGLIVAFLEPTGF